MHCLCVTIRNICCYDQNIISHATCTLCSSVMKLEVHSVGYFYVVQTCFVRSLDRGDAVPPDVYFPINGQFNLIIPGSVR